MTVRATTVARNVSSAVLPLPVLGLVLLATWLAACGSSSSGNGVAAKTPDRNPGVRRGCGGRRELRSRLRLAREHRRPDHVDMYLVAGRGGPRGARRRTGARFELIRFADDVFIKGSPAFYRHIAGPTAAQLLRGRWLKASATTGGSLASLASLTDLQPARRCDAHEGTGRWSRAPTTVVTAEG